MSTAPGTLIWKSIHTDHTNRHEQVDPAENTSRGTLRTSRTKENVCKKMNKRQKIEKQNKTIHTKDFPQWCVIEPQSTRDNKLERPPRRVCTYRIYSPQSYSRRYPVLVAPDAGRASPKHCLSTWRIQDKTARFQKHVAGRRNTADGCEGENISEARRATLRD